MRAGIILLLVVSLLAGNLLAVGHAHGSSDGATSVELHLDSPRDSHDSGHGTHNQCDVCSHTCGQPGAVATRSGMDAVQRSIALIAPHFVLAERAIPVPIEPPRTQLRR